MSEVICRKTMMRCQTPGMCAPHGGCSTGVLRETNVRYSNTSQPAEAEGVRDYLTEFAEGEVEAKTAIEELQDALYAVTAERDRLGFALQRTEQARAGWEENAELLEKQRDAAEKAADTYRAERDQLRAINFDYELGKQAADEEINRLRAEVETLRRMLQDARELIENGDFSEGHCMCGSSIDGHTFGDGHAPYDAGDYYAGQVIERIDAAMAAKEGV